MDKQIGDLSYSSDLDSETKKARIEAEKLIIEQQEKITQAKLERLQLQQEKILQDERDQLSRTDEQRKKIQDLSREVELKAEELRKVVSMGAKAIKWIAIICSLLNILFLSLMIYIKYFHPFDYFTGCSNIMLLDMFQ